MKDIREELKERTKRSIDKVILRAEKIRERELLLARKKYAEIVSKEREKIDIQMGSRKDSFQAQLRLEYRLEEAKFKDRISSQLLKEAKDALDSLDEKTLLEGHKRLIREAVINLGIKEVLVRVNKSMAKLLRDNYEAVIKSVREEMGDFESFDIDASLEEKGAIVSSKGKGEFFNNTFERRFQKFEEEFKERILEKLEDYEK